METHGEELLFLNETKKREHRLKVNLPEVDWQFLRFCVVLRCNNDSVKIVRNPLKDQ